MKNAFTFKNGELSLAKCAQPLKFRWSRRFQGVPSSIAITLDGRGRYYISFLFEIQKRLVWAQASSDR
jgi:putative transposase